MMSSTYAQMVQKNMHVGVCVYIQTYINTYIHNDKINGAKHKQLLNLHKGYTRDLVLVFAAFLYMFEIVSKLKDLCFFAVS